MDFGTPNIDLRESMARLWQQAFGDDREFIDAYLSAYDRPHTRIVRCDERGEVIAMMHYHIFKVGKFRVAYIYGVATAPAWRGQGLAKQMLRESFARMCREGVTLAMLIAEEPSLREWYATMDFVLLQGSKVEITGYDGMNFAMDDAELNVPMIRLVGNIESSTTNAPLKIVIGRKIFIPSPDSLDMCRWNVGEKVLRDWKSTNRQN